MVSSFGPVFGRLIPIFLYSLSLPSLLKLLANFSYFFFLGDPSLALGNAKGSYFLVGKITLGFDSRFTS